MNKRMKYKCRIPTSGILHYTRTNEDTKSKGEGANDGIQSYLILKGNTNTYSKIASAI